MFILAICAHLKQLAAALIYLPFITKNFHFSEAEEGNGIQHLCCCQFKMSLYYLSIEVTEKLYFLKGYSLGEI